MLLIEHEVCNVSKVATARRMGGAIVADGAEYHVIYIIALHFGWGGVGLAYQCQPGNMLSWQLAGVSNVSRSVQSISQTVGKSLVDNGLDFGWGGRQVAYQCQHSWCIAASAFASIKENVGR